MIKLKESVIVEGKYDKIRLASVIDAVIIETGGFKIFKDREKMKLIKRLADENGIIVMTDSDHAGFMIRTKLSSAIDKGKIKHAYIPDIIGKERRKSAYSKERKLGVEGMEQKVLEKALADAGVFAFDTGNEAVTTADLYELGLSGVAESRGRRKVLLKYLDLPENLSTNAFKDVLTALFGRKRFLEIYSEFEDRGVSDE